MAKKTAIVFGIIFLIAGIWGLLSASVLGLFAFGSLGSIIHIIVGIILLAMAGKPSAGGTLKTIGVIYVIFAIIGFLSVTALGDMASSWLYLILGVILFLLSMGKKGGAMAPQM